MPLLERVAYISLISLCILSGATLVRKSVLHGANNSQPSMISEKELEGQKFALPDLQSNPDGPTAFLFLSSHCHFCDASMPFYKRLSDIEHESKARHVSFIIISREPTQDIKNHLALHQVSADHIYQVPPTFTLLRGTPSILIVDQTGTIKHAFLGQLNGRKEKQVLELFDSTQVGLTCQASQECSA